MKLVGKVCEIITNLDELGDMCDVIDPRKDGKLVQEINLSMKKTMRENNLIYLTAPQIGYKYRMFCIKFSDSDIRCFINPMLEHFEGFQFNREVCASIPDKQFIRPRYNSIRLFYMNPIGKALCQEIKGQTAFVVQHCIDHLDGLTLEDIGLEVDDMYDNATDEEKMEVLKMYMESLDLRQKQLEKEIESDENLKLTNDAIKFMTKVNTGEIKLEKLNNYTPDEEQENKS